MSNDIIEGVDDAVGDYQGGVGPWVSFLLLHLVFWGEDEGEELDDGDDVQGKLTIPDQVSAELDAVHVVRLTLVVEAHLLQLASIRPNDLLHVVIEVVCRVPAIALVGAAHLLCTRPHSPQFESE